MKFDVDLGIFIGPSVQLAVLELGKHGAQRVDLVWLRLLREQPRGHAFERGPGRDHLDHFAPGLANDVNAAAGDGADKALALELRHRFAHRGAAHAEVGSEAPFVEPDIGAAAIDIHGRDGIAQRGVGAALEAFRVGNRGKTGRWSGLRYPRRGSGGTCMG